MQHQKILVPGHNQIRAPMHGDLKELVVFRIATSADGRGSRHEGGD